MKSLSLAKQLMTGFFLSLFAYICIHSLSLVLNVSDAFNLGLSITTVLYIGFILNNSQLKTGRLVTFISVVIGALLMLLFAESSELILISNLFVIFIARTIYNQPSLVGIVFYAALICFGFFIASDVLVSTNNWFLGFWCFFFVQSFAVYSDDIFSIKTNPKIKLNIQQNNNQKFNAARNIANNAIHQLSTH